MKKLDVFEQGLKDSLEGFEVPYNSTDWDKLSERLDGEKTGNTPSSVLWAGIVAGALLVGGATYFAVTNPSLLEGESTALIELDQDAVNESNSTTEVSDEQTLFIDEEAFTAEEVQHNESASGSTASTTPSTVEVTPIPVVNNSEEDRDPIETNNSSTQAELATTSPAVSVIPESETSNGSSSGSTGERAALSTHAGAVSTSGGGAGFSVAGGGSCEGNTVSFKLDQVEPGTHYLWNFGDGSFSNEPEPEHVYSRPGDFNITLVRTGGSGGKKIQSQPSKEMVRIHATPSAEFKSASRFEKGKLPYMHFENLSNSMTACSWDFGDGNTSREFHPNHVYTKAGEYQVTLSIKNAAGCTDIKTTTVVVESDNPLGASGSFSPNGDGYRDSFMPERLVEVDSPFKLTIYSKDGLPVFTTYSASSSWNGNGINGDPASVGEYVWMVNFLDGEYTDMSFQGSVELTR